MLKGQQFQYLHWVLGLCTQFLPQQHRPVGALFFQKLRFTQSSGTNECSQSVKTPEWLGELNTRPLILKFFSLFAGIAFNIYTKEITCHLVSVLQIVLSSGSLEKDVFRKWKSAII